MKINLQLFAGGHTVTVVTGTNVTSATASADSDVQKDAEVTMTIVCASGYAPVCRIISGGVTCDPDTGKFKMGEANVTILVEAKSTTAYRVLETTDVVLNGTRLHLVRNVILRCSADGAIAEATTTPTSIVNADMAALLLAAGKIEAI